METLQIARMIMGVLLVIGFIMGAAFLENWQRAKLFAKLTKGMSFGWNKPARAAGDGWFEVYKPRAPKWAALIPVLMIGVIILAPLWSDPAARLADVLNSTRDMVVISGLAAWAYVIAFFSDVVFMFKGSVLRQTRWLGRVVSHDLGQIAQVAPLGDDFAHGYVVSFGSGAVVTLDCRFGGAYQLAQHMAGFHPEAVQITERVDAYLRGDA